MKYLLITYFLFVGIPLSSDISHRAGVHVGGLYFGMGYSFSAGALYQMSFHRYFALELNANFNSSGFALGSGPLYSSGLDISLQSMLINLGKQDFSRGLGIGLGSGLHHLIDNNPTMFAQHKAVFLIVPLYLEIFFQYLFEHNWFLKTGFKSYPARYHHELSNHKIDSQSVAKIAPSLFITTGYCF